MLEKFLGASFVAPKRGHRCEKQPVLGRAWKYQPKSKRKIQVKIKLQDTATRSFLSCCFILDFTSADIIFHNFLELHSTLSEKNIFQRIHSNPYPFNSQNPLSMMKVFCQWSLIFFFDQTSNDPDGTKIPDNTRSL